MIGKTLGHYQITEKLGEGGMGEVYRAKDTYLGRQVAIKVLPDLFAADPERLARFEREAKVLASLNHPNIAAIHGLEEHEGRRFLVLELVEGRTLAERLKEGRIPLDETLDICRQVAEGLESAHEKGIIHRDLKPGNVMITPDDRVKILDFGLAKALAGDSHPPEATHSPTITEAMTRAGVIIGTAAYMSPEQAKGKAVDKRADIWAFGCILFECLAGKPAFEAETITETLAAILRGEPDWKDLPGETPARVSKLRVVVCKGMPNSASMTLGMQESTWKRPSVAVDMGRRARRSMNRGGRGRLRACCISYRGVSRASLSSLLQAHGCGGSIWAPRNQQVVRPAGFLSCYPQGTNSLILHTAPSHSHRTAAKLFSLSTGREVASCCGADSIAWRPCR